MTTEAEEHHVFPQLTLRRVDVLCGLASGHSESEIARELGLAVNGVRTLIDLDNLRSSTDVDPYFAMDINNGWVTVTWNPSVFQGITFDVTSSGIHVQAGKCSYSPDCTQAWGFSQSAMVEAKIKRYSSSCIKWVQYPGSPVGSC